MIKILLYLSIIFFTISSYADKLIQSADVATFAVKFCDISYYGKESAFFSPLTNNGWEIKYEEFYHDFEDSLKKISDSNRPPKIENIINKINTLNFVLKSISSKTGKDSTKIYDEALKQAVKNTKFNHDSLQQDIGYVVGKKTLPNGQSLYVIAFRGTVDINTWIFTDLLAVPTDFLNTGTKVHLGFELYRQTCMKRKLLKDFINEYHKDQKSPLLIITGHSLGAAAAVLQNAFMLEKGLTSPNSTFLVTFAEPCPGKMSFVNRFSSRISNYNWYCNLFDVVPVAPMLLKYQHFNYIFGLRVFDKGPTVPPMENVPARHKLQYYIENILGN